MMNLYDVLTHAMLPVHPLLKIINSEIVNFAVKFQNR